KSPLKSKPDIGHWVLQCSARAPRAKKTELFAMKTFVSRSKISRRRFIAAAAAAVAAPSFIPASALGKDGQPAPSERIVVGIVGWGMMGPANTEGLMARSEERRVGKECQSRW